MPDVAQALEEGDPTNPAPSSDQSFSDQLATQAAAGPREIADPTASIGDPSLDTADTIRQQVAGTDDGVATKSVQAGVAAGLPEEASPENALEKLGEVSVDGEKVTGREIYDALGRAEAGHEEMSEELAIHRADDALERFEANVQNAIENQDGSAVAEQIAILSEQVDAGNLGPQDLDLFTREAVAELFDVDPEDNDPEEQQRFELGMQAVTELAYEYFTAREADAAREAAEAQVGPTAEARAKEAVDVLRAWAKDQGFPSDAAANQALQAGQEFLLESAGIDLEAMLHDPTKWDAKAFASVLRSADAVLAENESAQRLHSFHEQMLDGGTDIESGLTMATPWGQAPLRDSRLAPPEVDLERVKTRMRQHVPTSAEVKQEVLGAGRESVEDAIRAGKAKR
jgi:hypothetical protein